VGERCQRDWQDGRAQHAGASGLIGWHVMSRSVVPTKADMPSQVRPTNQPWRCFEDAVRGQQPSIILARYRTVSAFTPPDVLRLDPVGRPQFSAGPQARSAWR